MNSYPHMCRDGHAEIGHSDSESERCPLCLLFDERDALEARYRELEVAMRAIKWQKDCGCDGPDGPDGAYINHPDIERDAMYRIACEALAPLETSKDREELIKTSIMPHAHPAPENGIIDLHNHAGKHECKKRIPALEKALEWAIQGNKLVDYGSGIEGLSRGCGCCSYTEEIPGGQVRDELISAYERNKARDVK